MKLEMTEIYYPKRVAPPTPLSISEAKDLIDAFGNTSSCRDLRDILAIVATTGIRSGELCNLRWVDVNFGEPCFLLVGSESGRKRHIPFGPKLKVLLARRQYSQPVSEFVLGVRLGAAIRKASRHLAKISQGHFGERRIVLHTLRHSFSARRASPETMRLR